MAARGHKNFSTYTLYNFKDRPADFWYRLRETVRLCQELRLDLHSFPMRYQPILEVDAGREYVGEHWTAQRKAGFMAIMGRQSQNGDISAKGSRGGPYPMTPLEEFEYWFGRTAEEFDQLISYPDIRKLADKKKGALRLARAGGVTQ